MYFSLCLVAVLNFQFAMAVTHTSALIKRVQVVSSGSSTENRIKCALELTKTGQVSVKIAADTDSCELFFFSDLTGVEPGYEYLEKTTVHEQKVPPVPVKEIVLHYVFSEVKVGDKFQFVIQKSNTDKFSIWFKDGFNTYTLVFDARSSKLTLKDGYANNWGELENPQYPFSDFKVYKIVFHVLESHWQIDIDDVAFTTFDHRRSFSLIRKIKVVVGPAVTYLTKASDPRLPE